MLICISGQPGIGKTTIIKKLVEIIKKKNVRVNGFLTEEIKDVQGYRVGFDVVTLKEERGVFARKSGICSPYKVGNYSVDIIQFENLILPVLAIPENLMIIDEIGKMELFSEKFKHNVASLLEDSDITIVAVIPMKSNDKFIQNLKEKSEKIFYVNKRNRNFILEELIALLPTK